jgi:hypothetical protein
VARLLFSPAVAAYLERHAVDAELAHGLGVRSERDRIVYPYVTPRGNEYVRRRRIGDTKTWQPKDEPLVLWWPAGRPEPGADVLLCEGEPDALAALSALNGQPVSVAALPGTAIPSERVTAELAGAGCVWLAMDGDEPGKKAADRLARALQHFTKLPVIRVGKGEDLASRLYREPDREGWIRTALEKAKDAPKLALKNEPQGYGRRKAADRTRELLARGIDPKKLELGELLDSTRAYIRRFVRITDAQEIATTLWVAHTHAFAAARRTPYLIATSPREECGKTLLVIEVLGALVAKPWAIEGPPSEAVLFRKIDRDAPTVLFDESESIFASRGERYEGMQAIIRGSNRRGATVPRCLNRGDEIHDFETFSPKAFAAIKADDWPRTQLSRSIVIHMQRVRADEPLEEFYADLEEQPDGKGRLLHDSIAAWATEETIGKLRAARPERMIELGRRAWESWVPLIVIGDLAGPAWGKRARDAARELSSAKGDDAETDIELALLAAIRDVFETEDTDRIWTGQLLEKLNEPEEAAWHNWNEGHGLRPRELANKLRPYRLKSRDVWIENTTRRGYLREDFDDAFSRYLPISEDSKSDVREDGSIKPETGIPTSARKAAPSTCENPEKPQEQADLADLAHKSSGKHGEGDDEAPNELILDYAAAGRARAAKARPEIERLAAEARSVERSARPLGLDPYDE